MALWLDLSEAFTFLGMSGTVLAVSFGVVAAVAFALLGNPSAGGMATVGWLLCAMLSVASSFGFTGDWVSPTLAVSALPLSVVLAAAFNLALSARSCSARSIRMSSQPPALPLVSWSSSVVR